MAKRLAERLIGSIRRECLDYLLLEKDAPLSHTVQRAGRILCLPILGGLHHQYVRI